MGRLRYRKILHGFSTRAILFLLSYISIPLLLNGMGLIRYSEFIYVAGLLNIINIFEFGNSNNLVELGARSHFAKERLKLLRLYLKKAKILATFAFFSTFLLLLIDFYIPLNPNGIPMNSDMRFSILVGVLGVGLNFVSNVYIKIRIAGREHSSIMNIITISSVITTFWVIVAAHFQDAIWPCVLLQFSLQPILTIAILKRKRLLEICDQNADTFKLPQDELFAPHPIFKFFSLFTPIYLNIIVILFSRQADYNLFSGASTFYRLTSIPLIFASFAWLNQLWVEIGEWKNLKRPDQIRKEIIRKVLQSFSLAIPFFSLISIFGAEIVSKWTNDTVRIDNVIVMQLSLLGLLQFIGVVPGAVMVVYRQTSVIIATHSIFLISIIINYNIFQMDEKPLQIVPLLIFSEFFLVLLPNCIWIFWKLQVKCEQVTGGRFSFDD